MSIQGYSSAIPSIPNHQILSQPNDQVTINQEHKPFLNASESLPRVRGVQQLMLQQELYLKLLLKDYEETGCSSDFFEKNPFYKTMMIRFINGLCAITRASKIPEDSIMKWCASLGKMSEGEELTFTKILSAISGAGGIGPRDLLQFCERALQARKGNHFQILRRCLIAYPLCIFSTLKRFPEMAEVAAQLKDERTPDSQQALYRHQLRQFFAPIALTKRIGWELVNRNSDPEKLNKKYPKKHVELTDHCSFDCIDLTQCDDYNFVVHSTSFLFAECVISNIEKAPLSWISSSLFNSHTNFYTENNSRPFPVPLILEVDPRSIILTAPHDARTPVGFAKADYANAVMREIALQDYHSELVQRRMIEDLLDKGWSFCSGGPFLGTTELTNKTNPQTINEIIILGSMAEKELSKSCMVKGVILKRRYIQEFRDELKNKPNSPIVTTFKKLQEMKIPIFLINNIVVRDLDMELGVPISRAYSQMQKKLEELKTSSLLKEIDFQKELIYEFEDKYIERKPPRLWLANEQLKKAYRHLAALKNQAKTVEEKLELDEWMDAAKSLDKKLRCYQIAHYDLNSDLSQFKDNPKIRSIGKNHFEEAREFLTQLHTRFPYANG